nr:basic proline-rich protein-like [Vicugna pacos]
MAAAARCQGTRLLLLRLLLLLRAPHPGAARPPNARPRPPPPPPPWPSAAGIEAPRGSGTNRHQPSRGRQRPAELTRTITAAAAPPPRLRADPEVLRPPAPPGARGGAPHAGRCPPAGAPPSQSPAPPAGAPPSAAPAAPSPPVRPPAAGRSGTFERATPAAGRRCGRGGGLGVPSRRRARYRVLSPCGGTRSMWWEGGGRDRRRAPSLAREKVFEILFILRKFTQRVNDGMIEDSHLESLCVEGSEETFV